MVSIDEGRTGMEEDYYKVLGVSRDASQADIQKAYREQARKYHPDLNPDDKKAKEKFQQVQQAFDVLNDASKREMYDRYGASFAQAGGPGGAAGPGGASYRWGGGPAGGFEDVDFSQFFGERFEGGDAGGGFGDIFSQFRRASAGQRGRSRGRAAAGANVTAEIQIPFQTAVSGGDAQLRVQRADGRVETIEVKIPAGVEAGKKIRLRGQGEAGQGGGPPGDLLITVQVAPHPWFTRRDQNLQVRVPITLAEAAAGAKIDVPTPHGTVSLRVPPGTSSGTRLRIKGQGVKPARGPAGDLLAEVQIVLPKELDDESLAAIRQIDERHPMSPRTELTW